MVTYTSGGVTRNAYDLRVPFERNGQQYPVLGVTSSETAANTSMAVFQRLSKTDEASRVDIYRAVRKRRKDGSRYWTIAYSRSWQGPFPLADDPVVAQEATPASSELLASEATTSEANAVTETEVAPPEVATESEVTTILSPDRNSCEDCAKFVEAVAEYTCYGVAEIGCGLVCFEPEQYVDLGSCEPQCSATIAAVCAAGVPANEDPACSPFCYSEELTGDELVSEARRAALSQDMLNVGPGADWSAGMQVGPVSESCTRGLDKDACLTFICHNPALGCNSYFDSENRLVIAPGSTAIKAFRHTCTDGNEMLAVSFMLSDHRIYHFYEYERPVDGDRTKTDAGRWEKDELDERKYRRTKSSHNGRSDKPVPSTTQTVQTQDTLSAQQYGECSETQDQCGCCAASESDLRYYLDIVDSEIDTQCVEDNFGNNPCSSCGGFTFIPEAGPILAFLCGIAACPFLINSQCGSSSTSCVACGE